MRDEYHRKIVKRLETWDLNPKTFEACACDLLRDVFPGLVPIPGGNDAGMDGAIPDDLAEAFPLACTTAQDVSRNLRESLESYVNHKGRRRKVALATSQALTARKRRNLEKRANERDFTLVQIFDQASLANRLYHSPRWCRELLDLPARPSALASVPNSRRPFLETDLIGRDKDLGWLRETSGDRVLQGQPGAGKTYLLYKYSQEVDALFLESDDEEATAAALLEHAPDIVIVDDAHVHEKRLELLRLLRSGHEFSILAATWTGDVEQVSHALGTLPEDRIHKLELLTRNELVEVYRQAKITEEDLGPDVLRDLVTQASNKPGLALTLATLWHEGAWQEVLRGEALRKNLVPMFKKLVDEDAVEILGCFSLGGKDGFTMEKVADFLELRPAEIRQKAARLASGGVLSESGGRYVVEPFQLRSVLLKEMFFSGSAADLPWRDLVVNPEEDPRSFRSSVEAIVLACHLEAQISRPELRELVLQADSKEAWKHFTALDSEAAEWALANYPYPVVDIAREALRVVPRKAIGTLLRKAEGLQLGPLAPFNPNLRAVGEWLQRVPHVDNAGVATGLIDRRRLLVEETKRFLEEGGEVVTGQQALLACLSPRVESMSTDPGMEDRLRVGKGFLPMSAILQMESIWQRMVPLLNLDALPWDQFRLHLRDWMEPRLALGRRSESELHEAAHAFAKRVLSDLGARSAGKPGLAADLAELGQRFDLRLELDEDPAFDALYPALGANEGPSHRQAIRSLVSCWKNLKPAELARKLSFLHQEAERFRPMTAPECEVRFARTLVNAVDSPEHWLAAFFEAKISPWFLMPLLEAVVQDNRPGWEHWLHRFLDDETVSGMAVEEVLKLNAPHEALLERALKMSGMEIPRVKTLCMRSQIPTKTLEKLLRHPEKGVALAAAIGEWVAEPRGDIRVAIHEAWREVVLRTQFSGLQDEGSRFWFLEILELSPDLADGWEQRHGMSLLRV